MGSTTPHYSHFGTVLQRNLDRITDRASFTREDSDGFCRMHRGQDDLALRSCRKQTSSGCNQAREHVTRCKRTTDAIA